MKKENTLIANFLGLELQEDNTYFDYEVNEYINQEDLNYNTSWDMLMQVVKKIKTLKRNGNYHYKRLMNMTLEQALNRDYVYNACVEFIKWWNKRDEV